MHETSAQGWYTGMTQRDGMGGRWERGSGWGTHVNAWLIHVNVWQKPLQYCKVISFQLIKINEKKESAHYSHRNLLAIFQSFVLLTSFLCNIHFLKYLHGPLPSLLQVFTQSLPSLPGLPGYPVLTPCLFFFFLKLHHYLKH